MGKLNRNKVALTLGLAFAVFHAIWALMVAIIPGMLQGFLNWIFDVHFLERVWILTSFDFLKAVELVIVTFVVGYVLGWIFAWCWNTFHKK